MNIKPTENMNTLTVPLLLLPMMALSTSDNPSSYRTASAIVESYEITIYISNDVCEVSGPDKLRIEIFDSQWNLVMVETNCEPLTVYCDLSAQPDGLYNVAVSTTTGMVYGQVTKS
jgi:hypothetical protein